MSIETLYLISIMLAIVVGIQWLDIKRKKRLIAIKDEALAAVVAVLPKVKQEMEEQDKRLAELKKQLEEYKFAKAILDMTSKGNKAA